MINFLKDIFLKYKLNKRLKVLKFQSKGEIKSKSNISNEGNFFESPSFTLNQTFFTIINIYPQVFHIPMNL